MLIIEAYKKNAFKAFSRMLELLMRLVVTHTAINRRSVRDYRRFIAVIWPYKHIPHDRNAHYCQMTVERETFGR